MTKLWWEKVAIKGIRSSFLTQLCINFLKESWESGNTEWTSGRKQLGLELMRPNAP